MTAQAVPDLRARIATRLEHSAPRLEWWQPALAAAAVAWIVLMLWAPPTPPLESPRAGGVDIPLPAPSADPGAVRPPRVPAAHSAAPMRRVRAVEGERVTWPEMEPAIEPLALAALTLEPLRPVGDPVVPLEIVPLDMTPLALEPLEEQDVQRRR